MTDDPKPVVIKMNPDPEEYQEAENEFLQAIGRCVTHWAFIDRQLFLLFQHALRTSTIRAATVYYKQRTLNQRVQYISDLFENAELPQQVKSGWLPLETKILEILPTRNILVHHPAKRTGTARDGKAVYVYSIYIEPFEQLLNKKYAGLRGKTELEIQDLEQHVRDTSSLERDDFSLAHIRRF